MFGLLRAGCGHIILRPMQLTFHTLDVFTNRRFGGNPLAVVLGADALSTEQMQTITREFNLSETIFVMKPEDPANTAKVRIFFPGGEMSFAGHPTVGCAVLLAEMKYKAGCSFETEIRLEEGAGLVPVKVSRIGDVPSRAVHRASCAFPRGRAAAHALPRRRGRSILRPRTLALTPMDWLRLKVARAFSMCR